jgi:hypothetical protein
MTRDWLLVATNSAGQSGRVLLKTPHEIGVIVTHEKLDYGTWIGGLQGGYVLGCLKRAIFQSVKETLTEHSTDTMSVT